MVDHVIKIEGATLNISPALFLEYARQYLECRRACVAATYSPVPYFLLCRSIELSLKARHLESMSRDQVRRDFGHDIAAAYDALPKADQTLDSAEYSMLCLASEKYDIPNKGFEYVSVKDAVTGLNSFPDLGVLERIAERFAHYAVA